MADPTNFRDAEIEQLKTERDSAWAERDQYLEGNIKLKAEIERLRAALKSGIWRAIRALGAQDMHGPVDEVAGKSERSQSQGTTDE